MRSGRSELALEGCVPDGAALAPVEREAGAVGLKVPVAGGAGAGKSTLIRAVSEIRSLRMGKRPARDGTPVAWDGTLVDHSASEPATVDFGRILARPGLSLCLFGMPAHDTGRALWGELSRGALGAVVLADAGRLDGCFPAVDHFERDGVPFVVAVNCFPGACAFTAYDIGRALDLEPGTPVVLCDARDRDSGKEVLIRLVEHAGRRQLADLFAAGSR